MKRIANPRVQHGRIANPTERGEKQSLHHLHNLLPQGQLNQGNGFAGEVVAKTFLFAFRVQRPKHPQSFLVEFLELAWFELAS